MTSAHWNWCANVCIPTNYMIHHGLHAYGNREYYDAETGEGDGLDPFWGWSLLAHFLPYEEGNNEDITTIPG